MWLACCSAQRWMTGTWEGGSADKQLNAEFLLFWPIPEDAVEKQQPSER